MENLDDVISDSPNLNKLLVFDITGEKPKAKGNNLDVIGVAVGPEGGLTQAELDKLKKLPNAEVANLGPLLLRAETACLATVSFCI